MESNPAVVSLESKDNVVIVVEEKVAKMSQTIKVMLESLGNSDPSPIPLKTIKAEILRKVIEWSRQHCDDLPPPEDLETKPFKYDEELTEWDQAFLQVDLQVLLELVVAANYLDIKGLLDATCKQVAGIIKNLSVEDIRRTFGIEKDMTPEQEEKIRKENEWIES